jgi:phthiocerol/phenolphthiocerol synthesis type-I polyketide synthase E
MKDSTADTEWYDDAVAVIGLAGRFPGARNVAEYWAGLRAGRERIVDLTDEELAAAGVPVAHLTDPGYVKRAAPLEGIADFDEEFFGLTPQAARTMDPQHRLLLETAWHALEDAGHRPGGTGDRTAVFAAAATSAYFLYHLLPTEAARLASSGITTDLVQLMVGNEKDYAATRISHALDLRGPSMTVQTACSSSLAAVHVAVQSLLAGECDLALAAGSSVRIPHRTGYQYETGAMVSADGHCRAFDAQAGGTVFGSGVGVVVLRPLRAALEAGDNIRGVIRGSAVNNDGSAKMAFTAPSVDAQAQVIGEAMAVAGVPPESIGYVEAHGTGTPLGDPVELAALTQAFDGARERGGRCRLGSVKSGIGHLEAASGIASLIKVVLMLEHGELVPSVNFTEPNPELWLDRGPFTVQTRQEPWICDGPRRAGVSSLGVGGTNVHVVLEESPARPPRPPAPGPQVLLLSARTGEALRRTAGALAEHLGERPETDLGDVACTLAEGRRGLQRRRAVVVRSVEDAARILATPGHDRAVEGEPVEDSPSVALLFPGQGTLYPGATEGLYTALEVYKESVDRCADAFARHSAHLDVRRALFGDSSDLLRRTDVAQAALFTTGYALTALLREHGIEPAFVAGHSIGEFAAATVAGVLGFHDAVRAVAERGRLMAESPPGAMLSVSLPEAEAADFAGGEVALAAVNEPGRCVLSGPVPQIEELARVLERRGCRTRRVDTAYSFHAPSMNEAAERFAEVAAGLSFSPPAVPMPSNTTGGWMTAEEATDPARWADQIRRTVRFADGLTALLATPGTVLVEAGPGRVLTGFARRHPGFSDRHGCVHLVRQGAEHADDLEVFGRGLGALWTAGVDVEWSPLRQGREPRRVPLPGYPFERRRHWVESPYLAGSVTADVAPAPAPPVTAVENTGTGDAAADDYLVRTLAGIWRDVLGRDAVAPTDNFFDLGGDSVFAIQVAAQANRRGITFAPSDLFDHQTVADLADHARPGRGGPGDAAPGRTDASPREADVAPLTPAQLHVLTHPFAASTGWATPLVLRLPAGTTPGHVRDAWGGLLRRHPGLRLRLSEGPAGWRQTVTAPPAEIELPEIPIGRERSVSDVLNSLTAELRASVKHSGAPLWRCAYLRGGSAETDHLVLVLHHFLIDNAARDVVIQELDLLCRAARLRETPSLPPATTPWTEWARRISGLAATVAAEEGDFWLSAERRDPALRLVDDPAGICGDPDWRCERTHLPLMDAEGLERVQREERVRMEDVLLGLLTTVLRSVERRERVLIDVQGEGRSLRLRGVDLARTVGWCTTLHPVLMAAGDPAHAGPRELIATAARAHRGVPRNGIGHGLLRHLHAPTAAAASRFPEADLLLCYLGRHEPGHDEDPPSPGRAPAGDTVRPAFDLADPARLMTPGFGHAIEVRGYRTGDRLCLDWWYDARRCAADRIERLAPALLDVARGLTAGIPSAVTSAEFPETQLTEREFATVLAELGIADVEE